MKSKALPLYVQDVMTHVSSTGAVLDAGKGLTFKGVTSSTKNSYKDTSKHTVLKTELYVRGLPWDLDNDGLKDIFKEFTPKHARVMKQKDTLRPLGFGFVGFPNADLAAKAMAKLDGSTMPGRTHEYSGQEIPGPRLGITLANSKTTKTRTLASKEGKFTQAMMIGQRKAELAARDMNKVVTGPEGMPRRWKIINDKNPEVTREGLARFSEAQEEEETGYMRNQVSSDRAEKAVRSFLESHSITDITEADLKKEKAAMAAEGGGGAAYLVGEEEDDDDEDNWAMAPEDDDEDGLKRSKLEDFVEDEQEERRDWELYQEKMRLNKVNLKGDDVKASGALRSGQKKIREWETRPQRGAPTPE